MVVTLPGMDVSPGDLFVSNGAVDILNRSTLTGLSGYHHKHSNTILYSYINFLFLIFSLKLLSKIIEYQKLSIVLYILAFYIKFAVDTKGVFTTFILFSCIETKKPKWPFSKRTMVGEV